MILLGVTATYNYLDSTFILVDKSKGGTFGFQWNRFYGNTHIPPHYRWWFILRLAQGVQRIVEMLLQIRICSIKNLLKFFILPHPVPKLSLAKGQFRPLLGKGKSETPRLVRPAGSPDHFRAGSPKPLSGRPAQTTFGQGHAEPSGNYLDWTRGGTTFFKSYQLL